MLLFFGMLPARSQLPEYQVKAAFLINMVKYADWPAHALPPGAPLTIAIVGDDPFGSALDSLAAGRRVNEHEIIIRRVSRLSDLPRAHVIFVSASVAESGMSVRSAPGAENALLVGDSAGTANYAAINFSVTDGRIVFEVNLAAAEAAGVKISSKLLNLARSVRQPRSKTVLRR
ncbi:MAG TPA: YfiR family protein [Chthoniobacteraceae bacterium]|jgi:hypothetical protein